MYHIRFQKIWILLSIKFSTLVDVSIEVFKSVELSKDGSVVTELLKNESVDEELSMDEAEGGKNVPPGSVIHGNGVFDFNFHKFLHE